MILKQSKPLLKKDLKFLIGTTKLTARFVGPYPVKRVAGGGAYELQLPPHLKIHPVFHVTALEPYKSSPAQFKPLSKSTLFSHCFRTVFALFFINRLRT